MERPRITLERKKADKWLDGLTVAGSLLLWLNTIYHYSSLPARIPVHYNMEGVIDRYGGKETIFLLPVIGILLVLFLRMLNKVPHIFNYPVKLTAENAAQQYRIATRLLRVIQLGIVVLFLIINNMIIHGAVTGSATSSKWLIPFLAISMILPVFIAIFYSNRKPK